MKQYLKKMICLAVFMSSLLVLSFQVQAAEQDEEVRFEVETVCGYDEMVKAGRYLPVSITVTNNGEDFEGLIRIIYSYNDYDDAVADTRALVIGKESSKQVLMQLPARYASVYIGIEIEDSRERIQYEKLTNYRISLQEVPFVGILTEDPNALRYLENIGLRQDGLGLKDPVIYELSAAEFPDQRVGLDTFDLLVINNFDTTLLDDQQYQALKDWVLSGGILLIGTGSNYQKTLAGFNDDFISGTIGSLGKTDLVYDMGSYAAETVSVDTVEIEAGGIRETDYPFCQILERGGGAVLLFDYDLGSEAFTGWDYSTDLIEEYLEKLAENKTISISSDVETGIGYSAAYSMLSNIFADNIPGIGRYIVLLAVYIIFSGPAAYLILKKLDKRNLMWGVVPAISFVFALIIFAFGGNTRFRSVFFNYASIVEIGGGSARETTYLASTTPKNKDYSFSVGGGYDVSMLYQENSYYGYSESKGTMDYDVRMSRSGGQTDIDIMKNTAFATSYLKAEKTIGEADDIELELYYTKAGYEGTITNNTEYNLTGAGILTPEIAVYLGDIKKGEILSVRGDLDDIHNIGYYSGSGADFLSERNGSSSEGKEMQKKILNSFETTSVGSGQTYFTAFTEDYAAEALTSLKTAGGSTLIVKQVTISSSKDGVVTIPSIEVYNYYSDYYYEDEYYEQELYFYYQFPGDTIIETLTIAGSYDDKQLAISIYNDYTGDLEEIFTNGQKSYTFSDPELYMPDNELYLYVENLLYDQGEMIIMPTISATGRDK